MNSSLAHEIKAMCAEAIPLIANVIFFAFMNIGKPRMRAVILYILNIIVMILVYLKINPDISSLYTYLSAIIYCTFCTDKKKPSVRFFFGLVACITMIISEIIAAFALIEFGILDPDILHSNPPNDNVIFKLIMMSAMSVVMMSVSTLISLFHSKNNTTSINRLMIFAPLQQLITLYLLSKIVARNNIDIEDHLIIGLYTLTAALGMLFNIVMIKIAEEISYKEVLRQKNNFLEYFTKTSSEYASKTEASLHEIRKIKHDFNNHLQVIKTLIDTNDIKNASDMISQLEDRYSGIGINKYSQNHVMNIILETTDEMCKKNNIEFKCECTIPPEIRHQLDICSITSNMLDNAYDAVSQNSEKRNILFSASAQNNIVYLKCQNSIEKQIKHHNKKLITTKSDKNNHGFGIEIIRHTAESHNGNVIIEHDDTMFTILVQLNITDTP